MKSGQHKTNLAVHVPGFCCFFYLQSANHYEQFIINLCLVSVGSSSSKHRGKLEIHSSNLNWPMLPVSLVRPNSFQCVDTCFKHLIRLSSFAHSNLTFIGHFTQIRFNIETGCTDIFVFFFCFIID